jgi:D-alanine-D-alanine ligase
MARKKIKIGVLFGGKSAEHEVSINSARNVINALDKKRYQIILVKISKDGRFDFSIIKKMDVIFPILHGPFGEDGSMQGLLKLSEVPFVGPSVLGSAVGMDKEISKRVLRDSGIPIGKFFTLRMGDKINYTKIKKELGLPLFIKPANMGSSVGISKVRNEKEFEKAIKEAFKYDTKIIIEEFIDGREIECAVLGNEHPMASVPGEIIANQDFYSYNAKYVDAGSVAVIPAKISAKTKKRIQELAIETFRALNCEGMSRVDFFLKKNGSVVVNEINTIPGFTDISMYPKLWEASGIPQTKLLDRLIDLAIERFEREQKLKTSVK